MNDTETSPPGFGTTTPDGPPPFDDLPSLAQIAEQRRQALIAQAEAWTATKQQAEPKPPAPEDTAATIAILDTLGASSEPQKCERCGCELEPVNVGSQPGQPNVHRWLSKFCDPCIDAKRKERREHDQAQQLQADRKRAQRLWAEFGPEGQNNSENIYRAADFTQVVNRRVTAKALEWKPGRRGMMIFGATGTSKTFTLYLLARKLILEHGILPMLWLAPGLRHAFNAAARSDDQRQRERLLADLIHTKVLMIDDIGQAATTEAAEEALFEVVEGRCARNRPTIITTQFIGEGLLKKFRTYETGQAVLRRLSEKAGDEWTLNTNHQ